MNDCNKCIVKGVKCSEINASCKAIREISEQSIRQFAEWIFKEAPYMDCSICTFVGDCHKKNMTCVETLLYEYEKEQENE